MVRWGILGAARIAAKHFLPGIAGSPSNRAVAVAARDPERAREMADQFGIAAVHQDYDALLGDPDVDAIYVPLATSLHAQWSERVLRAGKHVLCEKPIGMDAGEIDHLIEVRDGSGKKATEGFMVAHHPQWAKVQELLAGGDIGDLIQIDAVFSYHNVDPGNMRNQKALGGGGLRDIGVYPTVTARLATGQEPLRARGEIRFDPDHQIDTHAYAALDFGDFELRFTCATRQAPRQNMVFHGSKGFIELTAPYNPFGVGPTLVNLRKEGGLTGHSWDFTQVDQFRCQADAFAAWVGGEAAWPIPLESSRANQAAIDAVFQSEAAGRTWVSVAHRS